MEAAEEANRLIPCPLLQVGILETGICSQMWDHPSGCFMLGTWDCSEPMFLLGSNPIIVNITIVSLWEHSYGKYLPSMRYIIQLNGGYFQEIFREGARINFQDVRISSANVRCEIVNGGYKMGGPPDSSLGFRIGISHEKNQSTIHDYP